ncbi:hypothetical protein GCM10010301_05590 [Streptomyces plicatus]|nr:hypothetical protein GCM10010301_05590 [Streptomyces plicatus]
MERCGAAALECRGPVRSGPRTGPSASPPGLRGDRIVTVRYTASNSSVIATRSRRVVTSRWNASAQ